MFNTTNTSSQQSKGRLSKLTVAVMLAAMALASSVAHGDETTSQVPSTQPAETAVVNIGAMHSDATIR